MKRISDFTILTNSKLAGQLWSDGRQPGRLKKKCAQIRLLKIKWRRQWHDCVNNIKYSKNGIPNLRLNVGFALIVIPDHLPLDFARWIDGPPCQNTLMWSLHWRRNAWYHRAWCSWRWGQQWSKRDLDHRLLGGSTAGQIKEDCVIIIWRFRRFFNVFQDPAKFQ